MNDQFAFKRGEAVRFRCEAGVHATKFVVVERVVEVGDQGEIRDRCYWLRAFAADRRLQMEYAGEYEMEPWAEPACCKMAREIDESLGAFKDAVSAACDAVKRAEPYTPSPPEAAKTA